VWSSLTTLCGIAQTFSQLVALRLGVGVGEAGCAPPSHALIADLVPKDRRASALAFYGMGVPIGSLLGAVLGGFIAGAWGWRAAFMIVGMPGLHFSVLAFTTLREPRRLVREKAHAAADAASFAEAMRYLSGRRSFWLLTLGAAIQTCTSLGSAPFIPSFFLRNHAIEIASLASSLGAMLGVTLKPIAFLGLVLGLANGIAGAAGALVGGRLADRLAARDARAIMIAPTIASVLTVPMALVAFSVGPAGLSLCFLAINFFLGSLWLGPVFSSGQSLVPRRCEPPPLRYCSSRSI
jgi:predicted MFS family arabinose efflux permease